MRVAWVRGLRSLTDVTQRATEPMNWLLTRCFRRPAYMRN